MTQLAKYSKKEGDNKWKILIDINQYKKMIMKIKKNNKMSLKI